MTITALSNTLTKEIFIAAVGVVGGYLLNRWFVSVISPQGERIKMPSSPLPILLEPQLKNSPKHQNAVVGPSSIDPNEEHHSQTGKDDEEDRLDKVAAGQNMSNLTERGIERSQEVTNAPTSPPSSSPDLNSIRYTLKLVTELNRAQLEPGESNTLQAAHRILNGLKQVAKNQDLLNEEDWGTFRNVREFVEDLHDEYIHEEERVASIQPRPPSKRSSRNGAIHKASC